MIPLGYCISAQNKSAEIGFKSKPPKTKRPSVIYDDSDSHLLTIAPTGQGKGRCSIIPACLTYPGSLIVLDIKGEAAQVTSEARKKFGEVIIVDPFKIVTKTPDSFNPMEIILPDEPVEQAGIMLAKVFQGDGNTISSDPYWDAKALELVSAVTIHALSCERKFSGIRDLLFDPDTDYKLAMLLDAKKVTNKFAAELMSAYLQVPADKTRPCILSTAQQYLALLGDPAVAESLEGPNKFSVEDLRNGKPITIFFVIPPNKIKAYSLLLKLWMTTMLYLFSERTTRPVTKTLMIIDECSNLGAMDSLVVAITLLRSYGLKVWCLFQSLSQIKAIYPKDWATIVDNCNIIQAFGIGKLIFAKELAEIIGTFTPNEILNLPPDQAILLKGGITTQRVKKVDYLKDKIFIKSGFKKNGFYDNEI